MSDGSYRREMLEGGVMTALHTDFLIDGGERGLTLGSILSYVNLKSETFDEREVVAALFDLAGGGKVYQYSGDRSPELLYALTEKGISIAEDYASKSGLYRSKIDEEKHVLGAIKSRGASR